MVDDGIKSMKLYTAVERIHADLAAIGRDRAAPLTVAELSRFDQLHYFGTEAVDEAIAACGLGPGSRVLDIGAGFGGPARHIADRTGARVKAVEIQPDMNATAEELTRRCGLSHLVEHVEGDILATPLGGAVFDAAVSWLALYHIPGRPALFPRLRSALRPQGRLYVEDLYRRGDLTAEEEEAMRTMLFANTLATRDAYLGELADGGFEEVAFDDMTERWAAFTRDRLAAFRAGRDAYVAIHGEATWASLDAFYECIAGLLTGGRVGGVRIMAVRG